MPLTSKELKTLIERSRKLRIETFDLSREYGGYHFGGALSSIEILVSLYKKILKPEDKFILSKGHSTFAWYPLLKEQGYNPTISGHPDMDVKNGIHCTTGSLGMGFPTGMGMALSMKNQGKKGQIYVLMGEAECQEGTTWESLLIASQHKLNNLTGIIDRNKYQGSGKVSDIISLGNLEQKLKSFEAEVRHVDGHCHEDIIENLSYFDKEKPTMIIAHTVKGKGVKIMEKNPGFWHAKFPNPEQLKQIYSDLGGDFKEIESKVKFPESIDLRKPFGETLVELAELDNKIWLLAGDYESGINSFKEKFPNRYINIGTTEQSMISLASGMAIQGLKPVVYSITPFILERPFEQVKIGLNQQNVPVILVGFDDYPDHGPTHAALDAEGTLALFPNIKSYFPKNSKETKDAVKMAYKTNGPAFIRLQRDYNLK